MFFHSTSGVPSSVDASSKKSSSSSDLELAAVVAGSGEECKHVEAEPEHLPLGVSIQHLTKVYSNGKVGRVPVQSNLLNRD